MHKAWHLETIFSELEACIVIHPALNLSARPLVHACATAGATQTVMTIQAIWLAHTLFCWQLPLEELERSLSLSVVNMTDTGMWQAGIAQSLQ